MELVEPSPVIEAEEAMRQQRRARRTTYRAGALLILGIGAAALLSPARAPVLLTLHALWAMHVFLVGELVGLGRLSARVGGLVSSTGALAYLPAIVLVAIPTDESVIFTALVCMPLIIAALAPDDRGSLLLNAIGSFTWIVVLGLTAYHEPGRTLVAAVMCVACSIIGLVAMNNYPRSMAAESRANAERIDALKALAEMERDRASVERLVMLGQLTAGVAHEINNPLAAVIANVGSARAQVQLAGPMDGEVAETFRDVEDGLARIRQIAR
ncbi:MAG: hypothetical protein HY901_02695, partial [Deltaproteobacteria bacterium]|nr:hypothetical protein [Deltaproteobacteria bacterium]